MSSRFGDGKSYFLKSVIDNQKDSNYIFLTIYPVNYQIASNEDIVQYIKRDIFFQLMLNDILPSSFTFSNDAITFWFFVQSKFKSLAADLIPYLAEINLSQEQTSKVLTIMKGHKLFKTLKEKFDEYKKTNDKDNVIEAFLDKVESSFTYEEDIITYTIKESIEKYKKKTSKKIALIIEDLDRIDPAHLFRILNVFSAHMDNCYKYLVSPDSTLVGNKFGLDNIIIVADYLNIRKIFSHFYGDETDFNGYISKFLSSSPFYYSLRESRKVFVYNYIQKITDCPMAIIKALIDEDSIDSPTVRSLIHSFAIKRQIVNEPIFEIKNQRVRLDITMLKVFSVMRRLGMSNEEIIDVAVKYFNSAIDSFYKYVAPYKLFLVDKSSLFPDSLIVNIIHSVNRELQSTRVEILTDGTGKACGFHYYHTSNNSPNDFLDIINYMLRYIAQ